MRMARHKENKRQASLLKAAHCEALHESVYFQVVCKTARCILCSLYWLRGGTLFLHLPFVAMHPRIPCALSERGFQKSPQDSSGLSRLFSRQLWHVLKLARFTDAAICPPLGIKYAANFSRATRAGSSISSPRDRGFDGSDSVSPRHCLHFITIQSRFGSGRGRRGVP